MKICLAASAGGHLTELLRLAEAWDGRVHFLVTTRDIVVRRSRSKATAYVVRWSNRQHPLLLMRMLVQCVRIVFKERPDVVISTGAAVGCILSMLAKLMGDKVVWIETLASVARLSLSGRMVRPFADLFLVQWPELAKRYKGVKYVGAVI